MRFRRLTLGLIAALAVGLLLPSTSAAAFHLMKVREVGVDTADPAVAYVELQMYASGQNFVAGHELTLYDAAGTSSTATLTSNVANGGTQRSILIGTPEAASTFAADFGGLPPGFLEPAGGAVCFETIDCVSWGSFSGAAAGATGAPAPALQAGASLERTIAPGCDTLLEAGDDSNDSATDFALATPTPRNNATAPSERACTDPDPDPGGSVAGAKLKGKRVQKQRGRRPKVVVAVSAAEAATVKLVAAVAVRRKTYRLRETAELGGGDRVKVKLAARSRVAKQIEGALDRGRKVVAKVTARFEDRAGSRATERTKIKLK